MMFQPQQDEEVPSCHPRSEPPIDHPASESHPTSSHLATQQATHEATQPASHPTSSHLATQAHSRSYPASEPPTSSHLATQQATQGSHPATHAEPPNQQPHLAPASYKEATQPVSHPASEPSTQPVSHPASEPPASEPPSQRTIHPASEPPSQ
ncbi:transcriptional regulatory protein AlgP-like [Homarus americanus]|uniref:transcriptional regulatory protein AlgP-like n=1 Tax=Homarus americanus TaxID=6706 RepID=UPI001C44AAA5|nr:transcriptional regulatory protein AlgP-like [Homarus americanus]